MFTLIRILLAANIITATVTVPITVAGFGFGSGAGGSSFFQKANLSDSDDDVKAAAILFPQICDQKIWSEKASSVGAPAFIDTKEIAKRAKDLPWDNLCQSNKDQKGKVKGISVVGMTPGQEMKMLFSGATDRRVLYALTYLYQKRFSQSGFNMVCEKDDKSAPIMTVAVHSDADGTGYLSGSSPSSVVSSPEDDLGGKKPDPNISPHARGQALDIVTFGCLWIKDKDGKLLAIIPNVIGSAQRLSSQASGMSASDVMGSLASSGTLSDESTLAAQNQFLDSGSLFEAGMNSMSENGFNPLLLADGLPVNLSDPTGNPLSRVYADDFFPQDKSFDLSTVVMGKTLEKSLGLANGSLKNGLADLNQIGLSKIGQLFNVNAEKILSNKDVANYIQKTSATLNDFSANLPNGALDLIKKGKFAEAAKLVGQEQVKQAKEDLIAQGQKELLSALRSGGYSSLAKKISDLEQTKKNDPVYKLAFAFYQSGKQKDGDLQAIEDYLNGFDEKDPVLAKAAKEGAVRNFQGNKMIADWLKSSTGLKVSDVARVKSLVEEYQKSEDPDDFVSSQISSNRGQILLGAYNELPQDARDLLAREIGTNPPSAGDFEKALDANKLNDYTSHAALYFALKYAGLPQSAASILAEKAFSKDGLGSSDAIIYVNKQFGLDLTKDDFKLDGDFSASNLPKALNKIALWQVGKTLGQSTDKLKKIFSGGSDARLNLAKEYAAKAHIPSFVSDYAASFFAKKSLDEASKVGANVMSKDFSNKVVSADASAAEKQSVEGKIKDYFNGAIDQGKATAQSEGAVMLKNYGFSDSDAAAIAKGNLKDAQDAAFAVGISKYGGGMLNYDEAKKLIQGNLSQSEQYSVGDRLLASNIEIDGFRYGLPENATKILVEGSIKDYANKGADAITSREGLAKDFGQSYGAYEISKMAQEKYGVSISQNELKLAIKSGDWDKLGQQAAIGTVSGQLSSQFGIPVDSLTGLYNSYQQVGGLSGGDFERFGWDTFEDKTGFSKDAFTDFDGFSKNFGDNLIEPYKNIDVNATATGLGASIILGTLVGPYLAKIDPTGGLLTGFALSYAANYLAAIGGPYLLAAAFIINPQAAIASIQAMFGQAIMLFTNPVGFLMGFLSMFGMGNKPKAQSPIKNKDFQKSSTLDLSNKTASGENKAVNDSNKASQVASQGSGQIGSDANADKSSKSVTAGQTGQGQTAPSVVDQASYTQIANSAYLPEREPKEKFIKQVALRTMDQIVEDLLIFSLVERSNTSIKQNHWDGFMGGINAPQRAMRINQLIAPRILAGEGETEYPDYMYDSMEFDKKYVTVSGLLDRVREAYGNGFNPLTISGRSLGFVFSKKTASRVHAGF